MSMAIFLSFGFLKFHQGVRILEICKEISKKFQMNDIQMPFEMSFLLIQVLVHIEVLVQDEFMFPITGSNRGDELPDMCSIYDDLLFTSHSTLSFFQKEEIQKYEELIERFTYYIHIFNDLVMSREKTKTSKMILQLHPILMVHADSDFSEFSSLENILEEVESLLSIFSDRENLRIDLEKLDSDTIYSEIPLQDI